ncbi:RNA polymerase sigma factor [Sphingomonas crocodyli]|uniref:RNA polymerase sigma factor n=1 Tax=Sphingomonas crocodyli TaxID=1979270 RepID=A0A437LYB0_9SPHN|nr:RNA polymerase sigma factor [Sphingomonas crocodyli]RVT90326.1 RNA polymerase sigma factor [Sphingomonas crocodyli]
MSGPSPRAIEVAPGDEIDLDRLFRREAPGLLRYLKRKTGREDAANDMLQESFVRFATSPRRADLANPAAYLQRIARNLLVDLHRRRVRHAQEVPIDEAAHIAIAPEQGQELEARQLLARYEAALEQLSDKTRTIFLMNRRDGKPYRQIQQDLGISLGAVEYHMMRAIAHIDAFLDGA